MIITNRIAPYADDRGNRTIVHDCYFFGLNSVGGIALHGAPYEVDIRDCRFGFHHNAGGTGYAIAVIETSHADASRCRFVGNYFFENDNHISRTPMGSYNSCLIKDNVFSGEAGTPGGGNASYPVVGLAIDLRWATRGANQVVGNYLGGTYRNLAGGGIYQSGTTPWDNWAGNYSWDIGQPTVSAAGLTIAEPA